MILDFSVGIVIPCYNEETRFPISEFMAFFNDTDTSIKFCFVNDGSSDKTLPMLQAIQKGHINRIMILDLETNKGKAEAVRQGVLAANKWQDFQAIAYFDADLATPLSEVFLLTEAMQKSNIVMSFGSRILRLGATIQRSKLRHYFGRIFATAASSILPISIYDTQCGAKLIKTSFVDVAFGKPFINRWLFDVEIFFRLFNHIGLNAASKRIIEVPLGTWIEKGESKIKPSHLLKVPLDLWQIWRVYHKQIQL